MLVRQLEDELRHQKTRGLSVEVQSQLENLSTENDHLTREVAILRETIKVSTAPHPPLCWPRGSESPLQHPVFLSLPSSLPTAYVFGCSRSHLVPSLLLPTLECPSVSWFMRVGASVTCPRLRRGCLRVTNYCQALLKSYLSLDPLKNVELISTVSQFSSYYFSVFMIKMIKSYVI